MILGERGAIRFQSDTQNPNKASPATKALKPAARAEKTDKGGKNVRKKNRLNNNVFELFGRMLEFFRSIDIGICDFFISVEQRVHNDFFTEFSFIRRKSPFDNSIAQIVIA